MNSQKELLLLAGIGAYDWNMKENHIRYDDEFMKMFGYSEGELRGSLEEWKSMCHPEDLPHSLQLLEDYLHGKIPSYECEIRIRHCDGSYIWTRDMGKISESDESGAPLRFIGGHLNISRLKHSEKQLNETLESLESNHNSLESAVRKHSLEMMEQGKLLRTVNQLSKKLLTVSPSENFKNLVLDCLKLLGESINKERVYIWKDSSDSAGEAFCTLIYEWTHRKVSVPDRGQTDNTSYTLLPFFLKALDNNRCLNSLLEEIPENEKSILASAKTRAFLIAPITINDRRWGFIGVDSFKKGQIFTGIEETMMMMSGSMLASAIEKMETEAVLREVEERTQLMLNATPLCCNLWSRDFVNMRCNDEAVRLFDLSSQQEYLDRFYELSPAFQPDGGDSGKLAKEYIIRAFKEGYCRFEWMHQKLDGTPVPAEIILVRIKYKDDFIISGYTRDLREQKAMLAELKTKDALRIARDEALLNSKAKSNFLANMSHEIRTPLNAISGFAEIILRENPGNKTAGHAKSIKSACDGLNNIINDILDITKIESGKLEIYSSPYNLSSLIHDVITISRVRIGSRPLMFITDIDSRIPALLTGDSVRVKQILLNMLSNAIKYTPQGYVALRVSCVVEGGQAILRLSVKDSGVGIKPEDLDRLFDEFERINTTKNRNIEGTGLGLAISRQLCEIMGGYIDVESTYGEGSEFTAVIPQECSSYERIARVRSGKSILLYESRSLYRHSIEETLDNLDCQCISCINQSEFYENIGLMQYDYILTTSLHLKKLQDILLRLGLSVPVAILTDYGEKTERTGVSTIQLPVSCLKLAALLNGEHKEESDCCQDACTHFTAPTARVLIVDDNPVNLQVAEGLMEPHQFMIDTAVNGKEAVRMVQATEYDLVFMDHMMPEMDGIDATVAIRCLNGDYYKNLPVIALTANAIVGTREMFIREGMNDFLAKPVDSARLCRILMKWLPSSKIVNPVTDVPRKAEETDQASEIAGIDTAQGIRSAGGRKEQYLLILSSFHSDGMDKCLSLQKHYENNDITSFRTEIHALKSTSATIGAACLSSLARELEAAAQKNDAAFISLHLNEFLDSLRDLLEAVEGFLTSNAPVTAQEDNRTEGDLILLKSELEALNDALELANISLIEKSLDWMHSFLWPGEIADELSMIEKHLNVFDYDSALLCVTRILEISLRCLTSLQS